jgi:phosphatidylglycerol:prolipoprotein diacylglycerol transferase
MRPVVFTIPGINWDVPGYGLMLMIGLFAGIWWAARRALRSGGNPDVVLNCGFIAIIGGVVGARAMYVFHYWEQFRTHGNFLQILWAIFDVSKGGLEHYGGFILTIAVVLAWLRWREKVSIRWYLDIIAPSAALGLAFGRVGCLLNGCCFGGTCDLPWALRFPFGSNVCMHQWTERLPGGELRQELLYTDRVSGVTMPLLRDLGRASDARLDELARIRLATLALKQRVDASGDPNEKRQLRAQIDELQQAGGKDLRRLIAICENMNTYGLSAGELRALAQSYRTAPVHPAQPYATVTAVLIALLLNALYWRRTRDGQVICTLLLLEPVTRWLLEVIRADNPLDTVGVFTISQFLALCMSLLGLIGLLVLQRMPPRSPRARIWEPPADEPPRAQNPGRRKTANAG